MVSVPELCRGSSDCDCEEYDPPDNMQPGEKPVCVECQHGKSKHPRKATASAAGLVLQPRDGNKEVLRIFNEATRGASTGKVTLKAATTEVMEGFRPETSEGGLRKVDGIHFLHNGLSIYILYRTKQKSKKAAETKSVVQVSSVVVMTCGLNVSCAQLYILIVITHHASMIRKLETH
jgi:hypothetical protein